MYQVNVSTSISVEHKEAIRKKIEEVRSLMFMAMTMPPEEQQQDVRASGQQNSGQQEAMNNDQWTQRQQVWR